MTDTELTEKVAEIRELRSMIETLTADMEAAKDEVKAEMTERGLETLTGNGWKCTWQVVSTTRLDTKALKSGAPDVYAMFARTVNTCRFIIV